MRFTAVPMPNECNGPSSCVIGVTSTVGSVTLNSSTVLERTAPDPSMPPMREHVRGCAAHDGRRAEVAARG
jgi:hypothetical protein